MNPRLFGSVFKVTDNMHPPHTAKGIAGAERGILIHIPRQNTPTPYSQRDSRSGKGDFGGAGWSDLSQQTESWAANPAPGPPPAGSQARLCGRRAVYSKGQTTYSKGQTKCSHSLGRMSELRTYQTLAQGAEPIIHFIWGQVSHFNILV